MKWTLNRSEAAANVAALYEMTALTESHTMYKHLRPTQILISEKRVQKIQEVLETEYINPFRQNIDTSKLINLSSGFSLDDENADAILILHCLNILSPIPTSMVTLRCHSGDTDIFILAVALLNCFRDRVVYDDRHGKSRKVFRLKDVEGERNLLQNSTCKS